MYWTYIMRLWLSTIVAAPFIVVALVLIFNEETFESYSAAQIIWVFIIIGLILSIPTLLLFNIIGGILQRKINDSKKLKIATILILLVLIIVNSILFLDNEMPKEEFNLGLFLSFGYCFFVVAFGLYFKLELKHRHRLP